MAVLPIKIGNTAILNFFECVSKGGNTLKQRGLP